MIIVILFYFHLCHTRDISTEQLCWLLGVYLCLLWPSNDISGHKCHALLLPHSLVISQCEYFPCSRIWAGTNLKAWLAALLLVVSFVLYNFRDGRGAGDSTRTGQDWDREARLGIWGFPIPVRAGGYPYIIYASQICGKLVRFHALPSSSHTRGGHTIHQPPELSQISLFTIWYNSCKNICKLKDKCAWY